MGNFQPLEVVDRGSVTQPQVVKILIKLKRHNQAKIIKKSVFLFWLINMTIRCKHVHRLELQKFLIFVLRIYQLSEI